MSSNDKAGGDVATQVKDDASKEKERPQAELKETSPQKRSASELNNAEDDVKVVKVAKTEHKEEKNGDTEEKFDDADEEEEAVPEDYDEEDEGGDEDVADEEEDDDDDEA